MTYDVPNITFDEVFSDQPMMMMDADDQSTTPKKRMTSRVVSAPYDEHRADDCCTSPLPNAVPVSPSPSDSSHASSAAVDSITGALSNIEYKYHVDPRVLGSGHHGSVRECIDRTTGQRYAVKSIRKDDPNVKRAGLSREITLLREMKHRNIVQLVDVYEDAEYLHLVTDLCSGGELFDKIVEKSSTDNGVPCFTEEEAARIMYQILTAVSYLHNHDIAHRDIKPENILFESTDDNSPIKIIDFGLARKHFGGATRSADYTSEDAQPKMSTIVGTPYYIAPEVLRKRYTKSCDLWSVGVIAYILLCGYPPFNGANNKEVYDSVKKGRYHFPSSDWSGTTKEARDFIRRFLQKDPRKRMTVEQALNHPWIVKHVNTQSLMSDEDRQDTSSVEVVLTGLSRRDAIIFGGGSSTEKRDVSIPLIPMLAEL